jgi:acetyl-CoA synthetase
VAYSVVGEAPVTPSPDAVHLTVPNAFVILAKGRTPSRELAKDIFDFVREHLAPDKRVRRIEFSDLPKTISGKIRRVRLRNVEAERRQKNEKQEWEFFEDDFPELRA